MPRVLMVDSNLLLVLVVACVDPDQVPRFKRTKRYTREDADTLLRFAAQFDRLLVTPHVLTETSNFVGQLADPLLGEIRQFLTLTIPLWEERIEPSADIASDRIFRFLGLTDASIRRAATEDTTVLTDDLPLYAQLLESGVTAINFNHVRTLGWAG